MWMLIRYDNISYVDTYELKTIGDYLWFDNYPTFTELMVFILSHIDILDDESKYNLINVDLKDHQGFI